MNLMTNDQAKAIEIFNSKLATIEASIKQRGLEENQRAINKILTHEHNISDYELDVEISIHSKSKDPICRCYKDLKPLYLLDDVEEYNCNIDYKVNYNSTLNRYHNTTILNNQKHCWLLYSLYHDMGVSFENILNIEYICFNIKVKYQYEEIL